MYEPTSDELATLWKKRHLLYWLHGDPIDYDLWDDAWQTALLRALETFERDKGRSFVSYASYLVWRELKEISRTPWQRRRLPMAPHRLAGTSRRWAWRVVRHEVPPGVEDLVATRIWYGRVQACAQYLPPGRYRAVWQYVVEGYTPTEIARELKCTQANVSYFLRGIRHTLGPYLREVTV